MAISFLGSICDKIFKCDSCFLGTLCNCSRTTIVIGEVRPEHVDTVRSVIESANGDLRKVIEQSLPGQIRNETLSLHTLDDEEEHADAILIAIVDIAKRCLDKVSSDNQNQDGLRQISSDNLNPESFCRFLATNNLSQVDLKERFKEKKPITKKECSEIEKQANLIAKYGSAAAYLWEATKKNLQNSSAVKEQRLSPRQTELIQTALSIQNIGEEINRKQFADLSPKVQAIFLEAAKKSPKTDKANYPTFKSWLEEDEIFEQKEQAVEQKLFSLSFQLKKTNHEGQNFHGSQEKERPKESSIHSSKLSLQKTNHEGQSFHGSQEKERAKESSVHSSKLSETEEIDAAIFENKGNQEK